MEASHADGLFDELNRTQRNGNFLEYNRATATNDKYF